MSEKSNPVRSDADAAIGSELIDFLVNEPEALENLRRIHNNVVYHSELEIDNEIRHQLYHLNCLYEILKKYGN